MSNNDDLAPIVPNGRDPTMVMRALQRLNQRIDVTRSLIDGQSGVLRALQAAVINVSSIEAGDISVGTLSGMLKGVSGTIVGAVTDVDYQQPVTWSAEFAYDTGTGAVELDISQFPTENAPSGGEKVLAYDGSDHVLIELGEVWLAGFTQQTAVTAAEENHTIAMPAAAPVDAEALRDDLVANTLDDIVSSLDDLGVAVNAIRSRLETLGLFAS